jgi:hypothetical protein
MINQILDIVKSGARTNKYKITIPVVEAEYIRDFDFTIQSSSLPSRTITPVEVYVKGRKTQLRGETNLENTWDITFYNTDNMEARQVILDWMEEVHKNQYNMNNRGLISQGINAIKSIGKGIGELIDNPLSIFDQGVISYQKDITIEQLDGKGDTMFTVTLVGAFPINVSSVELDDSVSDISKTSVTFAFTDIYSERKGQKIDLNDIGQLLQSF